MPVEGTCPKCGAGLVRAQGPVRALRLLRARGRRATSRGRFTIGIRCPECGKGELAEKRSKRGKTFYGCTNYPECRFAVFDPPVAQPCPLCGAPFLVEKATRQGHHAAGA